MNCLAYECMHNCDGMCEISGFVTIGEDGSCTNFCVPHRTYKDSESHAPSDAG